MSSLFLALLQPFTLQHGHTTSLLQKVTKLLPERRKYCKLQNRTGDTIQKLREDRGGHRAVQGWCRPVRSPGDKEKESAYLAGGEEAAARRGGSAELQLRGGEWCRERMRWDALGWVHASGRRTGGGRGLGSRARPGCGQSGCGAGIGAERFGSGVRLQSCAGTARLLSSSQISNFQLLCVWHFLSPREGRCDRPPQWKTFSQFEMCLRTVPFVAA